MEKCNSVAQKREQVLRFLQDHGALLSRQGSIQKSWRAYDGELLGPYFRVVFRDAGKLRSHYLGTDQGLAADVAVALRELQAPRDERRAFERLRNQARAALREHKKAWDQELQCRGAYLKGYEVRGLKHLRHPSPANVWEDQGGSHGG